MAALEGGGLAVLIADDDGGFGVGERELGFDGWRRDEGWDFEGAGDVGVGFGGGISRDWLLGRNESREGEN